MLYFNTRFPVVFTALLGLILAFWLQRVARVSCGSIRPLKITLRSRDPFRLATFPRLNDIPVQYFTAEDKRRLYRSSQSLMYVEEGRFEQPLDHRDPDGTKWKQKYVLVDQFYSKNGVGFLHLQGEQALNSDLNYYGTQRRLSPPYYTEIARKVGAIVFALEHRYYGDSRPVSDTKTENLKYLTSQQVLGDSANFIRAMTSRYNVTMWILFGGSYGGKLAAWMRLKHPELVYGAIVSSAPVESKADYTGYYEVVGDTYRRYSPSCYDAIKKGTAKMADLMKTPEGLGDLQRTFHLCEPPKPSDLSDVVEFGFATVQSNFVDGAQFMTDANWEPMRSACTVMDDPSLGDEITRIAALMQLRNPTSLVIKHFCFGWDTSTEDLHVTSFIDDDSELSSYRQYLYQRCTEFGLFQTSNSDYQPFGSFLPLKYFVDKCNEVYGLRLTEDSMKEAVRNTNNNYGGKDIQASNIIFINGMFDPWTKASITETSNPENHVINMEGVAHCAEWFRHESDPPVVIDAQHRILEIIRSWVSNNNKQQADAPSSNWVDRNQPDSPPNPGDPGSTGGGSTNSEEDLGPESLDSEPEPERETTEPTPIIGSSDKDSSEFSKELDDEKSSSSTETLIETEDTLAAAISSNNSGETPMENSDDSTALNNNNHIPNLEITSSEIRV